MGSETNSEPGTGRRAIPRWLLVFVVIGIVAITVMQYFSGDIESAYGVDPVYLNIWSALVIIGLMLLWMVGMIFFSGMRFLPRLIVALLPLAFPFLFFLIMRPVNSGDGLGFHHFNPIWETPTVAELKTTDAATTIDLTTETSSDFAQFLGRDRNGVVSHLPPIDGSAFAAETREVWKVDVGAGWSGFVARNGFAITMEQRGANECVVCYEIETGDVQWIYEHEGRHKDVVNLGHEGPRSTPAIDGGKVYAVGGNGRFVCLDGSNGVKLWEHDLAEMLNIELLEATDGDGNAYFYEDSTLAWGHSGSPLIVDDMVVITGGGSRSGDKTTLLGFDKESGEKVWEAGTDMIAYGSPTRATVAGVDQILLVAEDHAVGYAVDDGRELWRHERPGTSETAANCSQVTVTLDGRLILSKGYGLGGELIELEEDGDVLAVVPVWKSNRVLKTKFTNPVIVDGYSYSLSDGFLECADLENGERMWKRRGRFGHGQLLLVGEDLLIHSEYGELFLIKASEEEFLEIGKVKTIDGVCWNTICLAGKYVIVRSDEQAACYELPFLGEIEDAAEVSSDEAGASGNE